MTSKEIDLSGKRNRAEEGGGRITQHVSFQLGNEEYGVEIVKVQEIIRMQDITRVPQMPDFIEGVINLRGNIIPIIDLRKRFALNVSEQTVETRIVVVSVEGRMVGVVVDRVSEVLKFSERQIEPPPAVIAGIGREYLRGIGKVGDRLIVLLDVDRILTGKEAGSLETVQNR